MMKMGDLVKYNDKYLEESGLVNEIGLITKVRNNKNLDRTYQAYDISWATAGHDTEFEWADDLVLVSEG